MTQSTAWPTLDTLFRRTLARNPDALALVDPRNKPRVTGQHQKSLTYAQADRAIAALAAHFIESGLPANSVIAVQLPNTVEFALTVLAANRAGLVVAPLPLLWRHADLTTALNQTAARALVIMNRIDGVTYSDFGMSAVAEAPSIRHVCGFGDDLPEGMASLDHAILRNSPTTRAVIQDGRMEGLISFDVTAEGVRPIPRAHLALIAGGLAISLESEVPQGATILSAFSPMSFVGLASSLVVWLLSGGTLVLHHPFDGEVLERQINDHACDTLVAPAPLALRLDDLDVGACLPSLRNVIGLWRAPEQVASSVSWRARNAMLTDVYLFGEAGLLSKRRTAEDGSPAAIKPGQQGRPRAASGASIAGEILLTPRGTFGLRGPMVPTAAYPLPPSDSLTTPPPDFVDTDYAARINRLTGNLAITAPPNGVISVGGYRFLARDLQEWSRRLGQGAQLTASPDRLSGHRLAGRAPDSARAGAALAELGLNPLLVEAFLRPRPSGVTDDR